MRFLRPFCVCVALAWFCGGAPAQRVPRGRPDMGPEIIIERYGDVVKASPSCYRVELENDRVRVLHARLPGRAALPVYEERSGVLVAITDVHLLYTTPNHWASRIEIPAGGTHWIDSSVHSQENLSGETSEFLFIETKSR